MLAKKDKEKNKTESINHDNTDGFAVDVENEKPTVVIETLSDIGSKQDEQPLSGRTVIYRITLTQFETGGKVLIDINSEKVDKYEEMKFGGVVSFVHDKSKFGERTKTDCLIFNANGIHRFSICDYHSEDIEHFNYPKRLMVELSTIYRTKPCTSRIKNCVFDHYFYIEQYREGVQVLQLYDLRTMQIQQIFNMREDKIYSNKYGKPLLAISKNEQMVAFSFGYEKLVLYLIENGLEIACKNFEKNTKIIACEFRGDDKLMIIIKKSESQFGEMLFWHLYESPQNKSQTFCEVELGEDEKNEEGSSYNARIPGKFISVRSDGSILSIYDSLLKMNSIKENEEEVKLTPYSIIFHPDKRKETPFNMKELKYENLHSVFHRDLSKTKAQPLVHNREPWLNNNFGRKLVYLDQKETIQLYIGRSTVQVWRKIVNKKHKLVLEYIWTNNIKKDYEEKCALEVIELIVYDGGFFLKVKWDGSIDDQCIQWSHDVVDVTLIKHACDSFEHLNDRRKKLVGYDNQYSNYHFFFIYFNIV